MITPEQEEELTALVLSDTNDSPQHCALDRGARADSFSGSLTEWFMKRFPGTNRLDSEGVMNGWDSAAVGVEVAFVFRYHKGKPEFEAGRVIGKKLFHLAFPKNEVAGG